MDVEGTGSPDDTGYGEPVGDSRDAGPVAVFCAGLRRRWQASGRDLPSVARDVRISRTQLYAILNGEIKRPPDFDALVRPLIQACGGTDADVADWRRRHEILVGVHAETRRRPAPRASAPAQLPLDVEGFVGRAAALAALDAATTRVVTITGTAGVGKTALAVHWAYGASKGFPDGQLYVNLRGFDRDDEVVDPADAIRGFLDALGVEPQHVPADRDGQAALYRSLTAGLRLLVILDNARDADQVRPLLAGGPSVRTVVTSRNLLSALVAEAGAQPLVLGLPDQAEAAGLLHRRAGTAPDDGDATDAIVAVCGRHPLALALVAARIRQTGFPLATVAAELRHPGSATLDGVWAVFSWSYRALHQPAARLFRLLGLTAGVDIGTDAVVALAGADGQETRRTLRELTDASLLTEHAPGRYQLHGLLRVYAAELAHRTDTEDDRRAALTRLLDHYTHTAHQADRLLNPTRPPSPMGLDVATGAAGPRRPFDARAALAWLGTERAVLLAALHQARDAGLDRQAWQLGWALDTFLYEHRHWHDEGVAWAVALRAATALMDGPAVAHAHRFLGVVAGRLDRFAEAHAHMHRAAEMCRAAGDRAGEAETEYVLSYVCWLQADHDRALEHAQRSLALWAALGHPGWEGKASNAVGWYHAQLGAPHRALPHHERAVELQRRAGDPANEAVAHDTLGRANHDLGHYEAAADHYELGLRLARAMADPILEAQLDIHLGDTHQAIGDNASARERWEEAYKILMNADHPLAMDVARKLQLIRTPPDQR